MGWKPSRRFREGYLESAPYYDVMKSDDDKLRGLLKQWRDIEPRANLEAHVWRRIRQAETEQPDRITAAEWLRRLLPHPILAMTVVAVASAIIGTSAGVLSTRGRTVVALGELQFFGSGTLAGGYVKLATERAR